MATKYLDSRRIEGLDTDIVSTPAYNPDFSSNTGWSESDSSKNTVNTSLGRIDFDLRRDTTVDSMAYDLGYALSDTAWTVRFRIHIDNVYNVDSSALRAFIGMSDGDHTQHHAVAQDAIGMFIIHGVGSTERDWKSCWSNGASTESNLVELGTNLNDARNGYDSYIEIIRTSSSTAQVSVSSTDAYDGDIASNLITDISGVTGLRYFVIKNTDTSYSNTTNRTDGWIDNLVIYNGTTTNKPTPALSLSGCKAYYNFEQTGTEIVQSTANDFVNVYSSAQHSAGFKLNSASSALNGTTIDSVTFYLKKAGSPTGTAYAKIYNGTTLVETSTNSLDVSTLTTSYRAITFNFAGTTTLSNDYTVAYYYDGGDGSNYTQFNYSTTDAYDSTNTIMRRFASSSWSDITTGDARFVLNPIPLTNIATTANGFTDGLGSSADGVNDGTTKSITESNTNVNDVAHIEQQVGANYVVGEQITSGNVLIGKTITSLSMWLYQLGTQTGSETFVLGVWDSTGSLQHSFGTITRSDIPVGTTYSNAQKFTRSTGSYVLQQNDTVGIKSVSNPNNAWTVEVTQRDSDVYSNGQRALFTEGSTPTTSSTRDIGFEVTYDLAGKIGSYAWSFDGSNDKVEIGSSSLFNGVNQITYASWVYQIKTGTGYGSVICIGDSDSERFEVVIGNDSANPIYAYGANGNVVYDYIPSTNIPDKTWTHLAVVYDGTQSTDADRIKFYINGSLVSSSQGGTRPTASSLSSSMTGTSAIGVRNYSSVQWFKGYLDETVLFTRALTSSEISTLYNSGTGREITSSLAIAPETNSIFVESDSARRYWFDGSNWQGNSVTYDNQAIIQNGSVGSSAPTTFSNFTVGNNPNRILVVACGSYNNAPDITGITWNTSENFTYIGKATRGGDPGGFKVQLWYLVNPTATTANVVMSSSGMGQMGAIVYSFYNVDQSAPIGAVVTKDEINASANPFINITPTNAGSMIVDCYYSGADTPTPNNALTDGVNIICGGVDRSMASQYSLTPTIGSSNTMTRTTGNTGYCQIACEIKNG